MNTKGRVMRKLQAIWILLVAAVLGSGVIHGDESALPVITPENAGDLTLLRTLGRGRMVNADYTPDRETFAVAARTGLYFHQMETPDAEPTLWRGETIYTSAVEYNTDGTQMAVSRSDGIWIVDVQTDAVLHHFTPDYIASRVLRFKPDGTKLASFQCTVRVQFMGRCQDDELVIWDLETETVETQFKAKMSFPQLDYLWFDEAWTKVLIQNVGRISIHELPSGNLLTRFEVDWQANPRGIGVLSADGQQFIYAGSDMSGTAAGIWNLSDIPPETRFLSEVAPAHKVVLTPSYLVSSLMAYDLSLNRVYGTVSADEVHSWDLTTGKWVEKTQLPLVHNIEWSPIIRPWYIAPDFIQRTYGTFSHFQGIESGDVVLEAQVTPSESSMRLWRLEGESPSPTDIVDAAGAVVHGSHRGLSPDGQKLLFYHDDLPEVKPSINVYDLQTRQISTITTTETYFPGRPEWTGTDRFTFHERGTSNEKYIEHWDMQGRMSRVFLASEIPGAPPSTSHYLFAEEAQLFSPDGHLYISDTCYGNGGGYDCKRGKLMAWDTDTGAYLGTLDIHFSPGVVAPKARGSIAFSPDSRIFAALFCTNTAKAQGCTEAEMQFWDLRLLEDARSQIGENASPLALKPYAARIIMDRRYSAIAIGPEIRPDQRLIAVSDLIENATRLWSVNFVTAEVVLLGKLSDTGAYAAFNADGTLLVTGGDGTIKLWGVPDES